MRPSETQVGLESECPELDYVETFNVSAEAQAALDREYVNFLEAQNTCLKDLCVQAWLSLAAISLSRAQRLLASANEELCSTSQVHREDS